MDLAGRRAGIGSVRARRSVPDAVFAGDGTHIAGCDVVGGALSCWSSLDGEVWSSLPVQGDTSRLVAAGTSLRVFRFGTVSCSSRLMALCYDRRLHGVDREE